MNRKQNNRYLIKGFQITGSSIAILLLLIFSGERLHDLLEKGLWAFVMISWPVGFFYFVILGIFPKILTWWYHNVATDEEKAEQNPLNILMIDDD